MLGCGGDKGIDGIFFFNRKFDCASRFAATWMPVSGIFRNFRKSETSETFFVQIFEKNKHSQTSGFLEKIRVKIGPERHFTRHRESAVNISRI